MKLLSAVSTFFRHHWKKILILVLLVCGGLFWRQYQMDKNKPVLNFTHPAREDISQTLQVSGVVDAKERARLRFLLGGKVTYLGAQEGDWVKRYQTIAKIDSQDLEKRLSQDLNTYFNQRMDFEQSRADYKDKATTTTDERIIQKSQKNLENKVLDVEVRDITIRNTLLSSPIAGILVSSPVSVPGVQLSASDAFEIVNPQSLVFRATIDERDLSQVRVGQEATLVLDAYPDREVTTTVAKIGYVSAATSTGTVFLAELPLSNSGWDNPLDHFRLGMNGDVDILLKRGSHVLTVPTSSIRERDGKKYVQLKKTTQETLEVEVGVGIETDDRTEIVSGLTESDEVLVP